MKKLKYIVVFTLLIIVGVSSVSASNDRDADFKKIERSYTLNSDGSLEYNYYKELTIYTHAAMNKTYGETFIIYNPKYQELKINEAYTIQRNGNIVKAPENAFVPVLPKKADNAPAFNNLIEMVVVHTGLELGATIHLNYTITTKPGFFPELDLNEVLQESSPISEYKVEVTIPEEKSFSYKLTGIDKKDITETNENGVKKFALTMKSIPASDKMTFIPKQSESIHRLQLSTYNSNEEAIKSLAPLFETEIDRDVASFVKKLNSDAKNNIDRVNNILRHSTNQVVLIDLPFEFVGTTVRPASQVLQSAYGTKAEKANLLSSMLRADGISSNIVVVTPLEFCGLSSLNNFLVKVSVDSKEVLLSPNATTIQDFFLSTNFNRAHIVKPNIYEEIDFTDKTFTVDSKIDINIVNNEAQIKSHFEINAISLQVADKTEIKSSSKKVLSPKDGYVIFNLPKGYNVASKWGMNRLNSERKNNLQLPKRIIEKESYAIELGNDYEAVTIPESRVIESEIGKLKYSYEIIDSRIMITREINITETLITVKDYPKFREIMNAWNNTSYTQLVFRQK